MPPVKPEAPSPQAQNIGGKQGGPEGRGRGGGGGGGDNGEGDSGMERRFGGGGAGRGGGGGGMRPLMQGGGGGGGGDRGGMDRRDGVGRNNQDGRPPRKFPRGGGGGFGGGGEGGGNRGGPRDNRFDKFQMSGPTTDLQTKEGEPKKFTGRCRLFVGNLTPDTDDDEFKEMFTQFGNISEIFLNRTKGFGFVKLDSKASADAAKAALDGTNRKGRVLRVRFATHGAALRVRNLSPWVSNELLEKAFSLFGEIERAVVIVDDRGRPVGEGIVEFARKPGAQMALKRCNEGCFLVCSSPRAVIVEPLEQKDEEDGLPEKNLPRNSTYMKEREIGPRFAPPGTFEYEFATRWKQLYDLEKQKRESLEKEIHDDRDRLDEQMEFSTYEQETNILREKLRQREEDANNLLREREMRRREHERHQHAMMQRQMAQREEVLMRQGVQRDELMRGSGGVRGVEDMRGGRGVGDEMRGGRAMGAEDMRGGRAMGAEDMRGGRGMGADEMRGGRGGGGGGGGPGSTQEDNLLMQQEAAIRQMQTGGGNNMNNSGNMGGSPAMAAGFDGPGPNSGGAGMGGRGANNMTQRQSRFDQPPQGGPGGRMNAGGGAGGGGGGGGGGGPLGPGGPMGNMGEMRGGMGRREMMERRDAREEYGNEVKRRRY